VGRFASDSLGSLSTKKKKKKRKKRRRKEKRKRRDCEWNHDA
jgi:hypothetical protein